MKRVKEIGVIPILCRNGLVRNFPLYKNPEQEQFMEKISPLYFPPRVLDTSREDGMRADGFVDRMVIRGMSVLRDDTLDKPSWRGDHSFSADAARYSLTHFIEPQVAKSHPDWVSEQVREHALETFESRLRQDQLFEKKESIHEESSVIWQPIQTEKGWELATTYGDTMVTLSDLWEHTKEFAEFSGNPLAYNKEEHGLQLRMQDALICGEATGFVSVLSHPDAVRYVQLWQKTDDGSIVSKHIDLHKTTGRDLTPEEGATLIHHLQSVHQGVALQESTYAHFFVREKSVHIHDIRAIALMQTTSSESDKLIHMQPHIVPFFPDTGRQVLRDTKESGILLGVYLREYIEQRIVSFRGRPEKPHKMHTTTTTTKKNTKERTHESGANHLKPRKADNPILPILAEWWVTRSLVAHSERVPMAAVAALVWTTRSEEPQKPPIRPAEIVQKSREHKHLKDQQTLRRLPDRIVERITMTVKRLVSFVAFEHSPVIAKLGVKRYESTIFSRFFMHLTRIRGIVGSWNMIRGKIIRLDKITQSSTPVASSEIHTIEFVSQKAPENMFVAFFLWWTMWSLKQSEPILVGVKYPSGDRHVHADTDPSQWVLLSIIWHLTMLRESGKAGSRFAGKKKARSLLWHHPALYFVIE